MSVEWHYNPLLQRALADAVLEPEPPTPSSSSTSTPVSCVGVTLSQLEATLLVQTDTIQAMLAALKTDILNVVATNNALQSSTNQILDAISDISCGGSVTPDPNAGYAVVSGTQYVKLQDAADAVVSGGTVMIHGEMLDQNATAGFSASCNIVGTASAKLTWTLGTSVNMALGKGLIVCRAVDPAAVFHIENIELTGARVSGANGAGVRGDGCAQITVKNCNLHDNENGVLSAAKALFLYGNVFKNNGNASGTSHGVYVNDTNVNEVTAEDNTFYAAIQGNQFKSRAKKTVFRRNTVAELDGACSYQIDISNGGDTLIEKNVIEQGQNAVNRNIVSYAPAVPIADGRVDILAFLDNWVINDHVSGAWGVTIFNPPTTLEIARNTFVGPFTEYVVNGSLDSTNQVYADRAASGLADYPALPGVPV
jgi:hypothetical protein